MELQLQQLKEIANNLGLNYHHMTGAEKLEKMIKEHCESNDIDFNDLSKDYVINETKDDVVTTETPTNKKDDIGINDLKTLTFADLEKKADESDANKRNREAVRLIRCNIVCNNPNKQAYVGEIFCVKNSSIPEIKKMVPFNVPTHVPEIMLNMIKEKQYQVFKQEKRNGFLVTTSSLKDEYNIQILPPLTSDEFNSIRQKQLAEGFNGE